jgi:hypothetical protein
MKRTRKRKKMKRWTQKRYKADSDFPLVATPFIDSFYFVVSGTASV